MQAEPEVAPALQIDKRMLGMLPNYRAASGLAPFEPISARQKFTIARKDSTDYPIFFTTAFFAGISQWTGSNNQLYGQGAKGYFHRYGITYGDQVLGTFFSEAIVPSVMHVDPRYFIKGEGTKKGRTLYALSRILVCRNDRGSTTFNSPEILGNGLAVLTAASYHPGARTGGDILGQWMTFVASDAAGQVLKEFWPDIKRALNARRARHDGAKQAISSLAPRS